MGEVYEAEDQTLGLHVALKVIREETARNPQAEDRFKREVQLAREVSHPNVCRLHDVGIHESDDGELLFLTMELLAGGSLRDHLMRSGPMHPADVLPMVVQMADALDAAHHAGIIHRDFKTANVVLVETEADDSAPRVVVTDFGLARGSPGKSALASLSDTGAVVGTPAYMAPEQVQGSRLTPAADIYALGIVIYEMVTGVRPFDGGSPLSVAARRLTEAPAPPSIHCPNLDPGWESVILRCLALDPEQRFQSAGAVVDALRDGVASEAEAKTMVDTSTATVSKPSRARRRSLLIGVLVAFAAAVVIAVGGPALWKQFVTPTAQEGTVVESAPRQTVAVLGLTNLTGGEETEWVSTALAELLTTEMGVGEELRTLGGHEVARVRRDMGPWDGDPTTEIVARLHRQLGADLVVAGSYSIVGAPADGLLRVDLRLLDASTGEVVEESGATGTLRQLFELLERAGDTLRVAAGVGTLSPSEALAVKATWPSDPEAARLFSSGLQSLRRSDASAARDVLQRAAEIEADHPLIHAKLAEALSELGYERLAIDAIAIARDNASGLPDSMKRSIDASFYELNRETNRAIAIYQELFDSHPDDIEVGFRLISSQIEVSSTREAAATLERMKEMGDGQAIDPRLHLASSVILRIEGDLNGALDDAQAAGDAADAVDSETLSATARTRAAEILHQLGDMDQAQEQLTEAQRLFEAVGDEWGLAETLEASAQLTHQRGDLATAERLQRRALEIYEGMGNPQGTARARHNLGVIAIDQGNLSGAEALFEQALATYREIGALAEAAASELDIGVALHLAGVLPGAEKRYRSALDLYTEVKDKTGTAMALTNLGEILFLRGDPTSSRELHQEALALNTEIGDPSAMAYETYRLGEVFFAADDLVVARSRFESAISTQEELGEAISVALTQLSLARLDLAEGRHPRAEELARRAEEVLRVEGAIDLAGLAQAVLADVLLASGNRESAVDMARKATAASETSGDLLLEFAAAIAWSRSIGVAGSQEDDAVAALRRVIADADAGGFLQVRLEAQLALAKILLAAGDRQAATEELQTTIRTAEENGLGLVLRQARALLPKD